MQRNERMPSADVFTSRHALSQGMTPAEIRWARRTGSLLVLRRGVYCRREAFDQASAEGRHLLHARAALLAHDERHVLSHLSAAVSWGFPTPLGGPGRPTLTLPGAPASTDRQDDLIVQVAELRPQDRVPWHDGQRTSVTRTVADCLRHLPAPDAVAIADHAVHFGQTSLGAVDETLTWQGRWPYAHRGRFALGLVDGRRESPLESGSFVKLFLHGVPLPEPQPTVYDDAGAIGRVDGWWPEQATVCEVDGRGKYAVEDWRDLGSGDPKDLFEQRITAARRALIREKVREDRLRAAGLQVVRWGTFDIERNIVRVVHNIEGAWRRGDPGRVTARVVRLHPP